MMNARKYLDSLLEAGVRIKLKQEQVQRLQDSLTSLSAPIDQVQVTHTRNVSIMADTVSRIADIQAEIDRQTSALYEKRRQALRYFDMLKPAYTQLLTVRYINGMKFSEIAHMMHYASSSVFKIHRQSVSALQDLFDSMTDEQEYSKVEFRDSKVEQSIVK